MTIYPAILFGKIGSKNSPIKQDCLYKQEGIFIIFRLYPQPETWFLSV